MDVAKRSVDLEIHEHFIRSLKDPERSGGKITVRQSMRQAVRIGRISDDVLHVLLSLRARFRAKRLFTGPVVDEQVDELSVLVAGIVTEGSSGADLAIKPFPLARRWGYDLPDAREVGLAPKTRGCFCGEIRRSVPLDRRATGRIVQPLRIRRYWAGQQRSQEDSSDVHLVSLAVCPDTIRTVAAPSRRNDTVRAGCASSQGTPCGTGYNESVKVRDLMRLVGADGWQHVRTTGSHRHRHPSKPNVVTIPGHPGDDLPTGTLKSIQKAAGLEKKQ